MKTKIILSIIISITIFASCQKKIPLNLPEEKQMIVVNGVLMADSTLSVNVSKTINIADTNHFLPKINDATVKLYNDGTFLENLQNTEEGNYISTITILENEKYTIEVITDDKTITNEIVTPAKTNIQKTNFVGYDENSQLYSFQLKLTDNPQREFYVLEPFAYLPEYKFDEFGEIDTITFSKQRVYLSSKNTQNPFYNFQVYLHPYFSGYLFNDSYFNNSEFEINFDIFNYFYIDTSVVDFDSLTIYFKLIKIDSNLYNFFESSEKYYNANGNPFVEPVNIYSNIKGGAGILGSLSATIDSIKVKYINNFDYYPEY